MLVFLYSFVWTREMYKREEMKGTNRGTKKRDEQRALTIFTS